MIVGVVTDLQARVEIVLRLADRDDQAIECVVDTGFQGELALPPATIASLGLLSRGRTWAKLADDSPSPTRLRHPLLVTGISISSFGA